VLLVPLLTVDMPGDVTDLGDEHRAQQRPDAGNGLNRDVAGISAQPPGDQPGEGVDLEVNAVITRSSESTRERDSTVSRVATVSPVEQLLPARSEQITHRHRHPGAGEHRVDLVLQTGT
jgi:hypothetical protein